MIAKHRFEYELLASYVGAVSPEEAAVIPDEELISLASKYVARVPVPGYNNQKFEMALEYFNYSVSLSLKERKIGFIELIKSTIKAHDLEYHRLMAENVGYCRFCGADDDELVFGLLAIHENSIQQDVGCKRCDMSWTDKFTYSGYEIKGGPNS